MTHGGMHRPRADTREVEDFARDRGYYVGPPLSVPLNSKTIMTMITVSGAIIAVGMAMFYPRGEAQQLQAKFDRLVDTVANIDKEHKQIMERIEKDITRLEEQLSRTKRKRNEP